jgi:hypothetical protein
VPPTRKFRKVITEHTQEFTRDDLLNELDIPGMHYSDAKISVEVPTGGDYSGCTLVIGEDVPHITVSYTTTEVHPDHCLCDACICGRCGKHIDVCQCPERRRTK